MLIDVDTTDVKRVRSDERDGVYEQTLQTEQSGTYICIIHDKR